MHTITKHTPYNIVQSFRSNVKNFIAKLVNIALKFLFYLFIGQFAMQIPHTEPLPIF